MKQWQETRQLLDRLSELHHGGRRAALATVVRVQGSAYRREGAKLLVAEDGSTLGNVSGGCLEQDVVEVGLQVIRSGTAQLRRYCSGADEVEAWDLGVGCEGQVEVYVEPAPAPRPLERAPLSGDEAFAVCTRLAATGERPLPGRLVVTAGGAEGTLGDAALDRLAAVHARRELGGGSSRLVELGGRPVFVDLFAPPPRLLVVGAGDDARPLARLAAEIGFRVTVADRRAGLLEADRFPADARLVHSHAAALAERVPLDERTYAVLMTHSYADDLRYLGVLARAPLPYIGVLGPRQRTERILRALEADGPVDESRVFGPVGLDIGTEGAEQVALSVLAEILAVRSGRGGGPLRERVRPIHAAFG